MSELRTSEEGLLEADPGRMRRLPEGGEEEGMLERRSGMGRAGSREWEAAPARGPPPQMPLVPKMGFSLSPSLPLAARNQPHLFLRESRNFWSIQVFDNSMPCSGDLENVIPTSSVFSLGNFTVKLPFESTLSITWDLTF